MYTGVHIPWTNRSVATYRLELMIAGVLAGLAVVYFFWWRDVALLLRPDSLGSLAAAQDLADGSLSRLPIRSLGYPLLICALGVHAAGDGMIRLFVVQLLLHFSLILIAVLTLRRLAVRSWLALGVLVALMIQPLIVGSTALLMSETLSMFLLVVGLCALLLYLNGSSWLVGLFSGVALSYLALVRPTFQLLIVVLAMVLLLGAWGIPRLRRRSLVALLLNGGMALLIIGGMMAYNQQRFGFTGLTPLIGYNLATRTPYALELIRDPQVREIMIRHRHETITTDPLKTSANGVVRYIWPASIELMQTLNMDELTYAKYLRDLTLDLIRRAPYRYVEIVSTALGRYILPYSPGEELLRGPAKLPFDLLHGITLLYVLGMIAVAVGAGVVWGFAPRATRRAWGERLAQADLVKVIGVALWLSIAAYNLVISVGIDVGSPRHRLPTDPLLFMTAAVMLDYLLRLRHGVIWSGIGAESGDQIRCSRRRRLCVGR